MPQQTPLAVPSAAASIGPDLTALLIDLSVAVQRRAMYPGGHPSLALTEQRLFQRLTTLLSQREVLAVGVARDQLVIDGIGTEARHHLLGALAERLHAHQIAGIKFLAGVTTGEVTELLTRVGRDPRAADDRREPLSGAFSPHWEHVQLFRQAYERLALADDGGDAAPGPHALPRAAQLWLDLAQAAMSAGDAAADAETDPAAMARAIDAAGQGQAGASPYEQAVVGHLMQIAGELRAGQGADTAALRDRVSRLVTTLSPDAIQRLLAMGGNLTQRRAFLLDATAGMAVDAVYSLAIAAADAGQRTISQPLTRLLVKLANHAQRGAPQIRSAADAAFRDHVRELIEGWTLPDPTPAGYSDVLDHMTRPAGTGAATTGITQICEPERALEMCLELRNASPQLWEAISALLARGDIVSILDTLDSVPQDNPIPGIVRTRIATKENFRRLLDSPTVDGKRVEDFARRVGDAATEVLLDALGEASSRSARRRLLDVLTHLGEGIGPAIVARLPTAPWYVQRNLLVLAAGLPVWPAGFSPLTFATHPDGRVRREALRALLRRPETRIAGIIAALADEDSQLVRLGLDAAAKECSPAVVPRLINRIGAGSLPSELSTFAIQILADSGAPAAVPCLLALATRRTRFLKRERVALRSPAVLAALGGLAQWSADPRVGKLLAKASKSSDPAIRDAIVRRRKGTGQPPATTRSARPQLTESTLA